MSRLDKFSVFLLAMATLTPMYGGFLGYFRLNPLLHLIYFSGLTLFLITNFYKMMFSLLDLLIVIFSLLFIASLAYTVNQDFKTELILFGILPLFYFNGKLLVYSKYYEHFFRFYVIIIIIVNIYIFFKLGDNNFNYNKYYKYSKSMLLLDYLTMALFDLIGAIILYTTNIIKTPIIKGAILSLFLFMILISGARYSILFLGLAIFVFYTLLPLKKKIVSMFTFGTIGTMIILLNPKIMDLFAYSIFRLTNMSSGNDASLDGRGDVMNKSLYLINESPLFGYGLNSSEELLYPLPFPHNMIVEAFLETGFLNALNLTVIVTSTLFMATRLFLKDKNYFAGILIIDLYIIMSHLKSFSVAEGKILFFFFGITAGFYSLYFRKTYY